MKPMLAAKITEQQLEQLPFPVLVSPKIDGIRCLINGGTAFSRSLKPIRNRHVQTLASFLPAGLDGELTFGTRGRISPFRQTSSEIMSAGGSKEFTFNIFDKWNIPERIYTERLKVLKYLYSGSQGLWPNKVCLVPQIQCYRIEEVLACEDSFLAMGYEGIIIRNPRTTYKYNRSTLREGKLLKLKRFIDAEARIIGYEELMHNGNPEERNALGYAEHSRHQENLYPMNMLGALIVENEFGVHFNIGTGFTEAERKHIWRNKETYRGSLVKYKYFAASGHYDKPRHPVFLGFRDKEDL